MIIYLPLLIAIIGALVYALAANPKAAELGRLMFFCGLWVFLLVYGGSTVTALRR